MLLRSVSCGVLAGMVLAASVGSELASADEPDPLKRGLGQTVPAFELPDVRTGESIALEDFDDHQAVVVVFTGVGCPIGNLYMPRLIRLAERLEPEGVAFLAINSNQYQTVEEIKADAESFDLPFPVLRDKGNVVADQLLAERTCEALVIDGDGVLRYRGAIDDQYGLGFAKEAPSKHFLANAIEAVINGEALDTAATSVVGCPIERASNRVKDADLMRLDVSARVNALIKATDRIRPPSEQIEAAWREIAPNEDALIDEVGPVTYANDVAEIVQAKCQSCHRPGEVGPFPLMTYEEVRRRATGIQEVVDLRRMPPWHADPRYGEFANDRSLTPEERATILAWIEQGAPEGDPAEMPEPKDWTEGWLIGEPDVVIEMPKPYTVKAEGFEPYKYFRVPLEFEEDVWIQAAEARPTDRAVVHHIIAYIIPKDGDDRGRRREHLCGFAPGEMPTICPPGAAKKIPAGSQMLLEVHYTPIGKVRVDQSKVGLIFADGPIESEARTIGIANPRFEIPPHADNHPVRREFIFPRDAELIAFMPHMHYRGKSFRYTATYVDGTSEILLDVPAYDFNWQSYYYLKEPIAFRKGERIDCLAHYDNSENNPVNPDPSKSVTWGDQTWDEMMIGYIDVLLPLAPDERPKLEGQQITEAD